MKIVAMGKIERHPENVEGDFYTVIGCVLCNAPASAAPSLIDYAKDERGEDDNCIVIKQPKTNEELDDMIEAMDV